MRAYGTVFLPRLTVASCHWTHLYPIADSLDLVELTLELEEMKVEIDVPIKTVGDFLWLVKNIELRKSRTGSAN
jgi:hypothetical protein